VVNSLTAFINQSRKPNTISIKCWRSAQIQIDFVLNFITPQSWQPGLFTIKFVAKTFFIRYAKNISLFFTAVVIAFTIIILANSRPAQAPVVPVSSGGSPDKSGQLEKARKNSIMRRFISYNEAQNALY